MASTKEARAPWGREAISQGQAEEFAAHVPAEGERDRIARMFLEFPTDAQVRGMFFKGLMDVVERRLGGAKRQDLVSLAAIRDRFVPFSLYPHRDFYKLYFLAAATLEPRAFRRGLRRIAETFYPIFQESMLGRTMSVFVGDTPLTMLKRLADAYNLSAPWNEHRVEPLDREARWHCTVEPCELYPHAFEGIVQGMMVSHHVPSPRIEKMQEARRGRALCYEFRVHWR